MKANRKQRRANDKVNREIRRVQDKVVQKILERGRTLYPGRALDLRVRQRGTHAVDVVLTAALEEGQAPAMPVPEGHEPRSVLREATGMALLPALQALERQMM